MTKEITKSNILQELQDKLALRELVPERFTFSEMVMPIYDIGSHLTEEVRGTQTNTITATGGSSFFLVPDDEIWKLHRYNVVFVTGSYKVAGVMIGRPSLANYVYLDLTLNQTVSYAYNLPAPVRLAPKEHIYINVDHYTSTGDLTLIIDVTKEKIR